MKQKFFSVSYTAIFSSHLFANLFSCSMLEKCVSDLLRYTESEQVYVFLPAVPLGITHSKYPAVAGFANTGKPVQALPRMGKY